MLKENRVIPKFFDSCEKYYLIFLNFYKFRKTEPSVKFTPSKRKNSIGPALRLISNCQR